MEVTEPVQTCLEAGSSTNWLLLSPFYVVDVIEVEDGEGVLIRLNGNGSRSRRRGRRGGGGDSLVAGRVIASLL